MRSRAALVRSCLTWALLWPGLATAQGLGAPIGSAPPSAVRMNVTPLAAPSTLLLAPGAPAHRVELPPPAALEVAAMKAKNSARTDAVKRTSTKALAIGFGRVVPAASRTIPLSGLTWIAVHGGGRSARIEIRSAGAAALRVAMQLPATHGELTLRFAGSGANAEVFGPIPASAVSRDTEQFGEFWSPVLDGEIATVEIHAGAGVELDGTALTLPRLSHQVVRSVELRALAGKTVTEIGLAQSCNIDVACVTPTAALSDAASSVAQLFLVGEDGGPYLCTGTLLNDVPSTGTPYLYTAAHCIPSAKVARTLNTFWFFDAVACRSKTVPPYVQRSAGATLLARSQDRDWALLRLNELPPPGALHSAWRAEPLAPGAVTTTLHHPMGDLKKWSQGIVKKSVELVDSSVHGTFNEVAYTSGITEGGSSGSALLTYLDAGGYYEVRGGVSEGNFVSCPVAPGVAFDDYSRMEDMLPLVRQYLTPLAPNPTGQVAAVEFYNKTLNHYFLTSNAGDIDSLDRGAFVGWERTGLRFLANVKPTAGTNPVCRFYRKPAFGDSHFYSASPQECSETATKYVDEWVYESPAVFYIYLPDAKTGACPTGTQPVWRFFNKVTINHRYTAELVIRDQMRAKPSVWIPEGYGPEATIMCSALR
ncbi:MAG: serine protease [Betaproteobacteria bacterium]